MAAALAHRHSNPVAASGSTPKSSHGYVFNHTVDQPTILSTLDRVRLSIYLSMRVDRNAGDLHLDGTRMETSRLKPLDPFAIAEWLLSPGPAGPDYLIGD